MSYRFTGDFPLTYPAYRDAATDHTLTAVPGTIYDVEAASGRDVPVPPDDGRWEPVTGDPSPEPAPEPWAEPAPPPPAEPDVTTASTEDEGK